MRSLGRRLRGDPPGGAPTLAPPPRAWTCSLSCPSRCSRRSGISTARSTPTRSPPPGGGGGRRPARAAADDAADANANANANANLSPRSRQPSPPALIPRCWRRFRRDPRRRPPQLRAPPTPSGPPADPANAEDMDNASFVASLVPDVRTEILLEADADFIRSLPPALRAEANALRERAQETAYRQRANASNSRSERQQVLERLLRNTMAVAEDVGGGRQCAAQRSCSQDCAPAALPL